MNVQARLPSNADDFLRWNEDREGKWEFVEGKVVDMMVKVTRNHAVLCARLLALMTRSLRFPPYTVSSADFGVRTDTSIRYPDVMVDAAPGSGNDLAAERPVFIAEVLSRGTMSVDFGAKANEYKTIASLGHYLVLAQDEPRVWLWSRDEAGNWGDEEMVFGMEGIVALPYLDVTVALAELYGGLDLTA